MSILSCDKVRSENVDVTIVRRENAVDIFLEDVPYVVTNVTTSGVITSGNNIVLNANGYVDAQNLFIRNGTSAISNVKTIGFRFFMHNGYLKCVKKEMSYYNHLTYTITAQSTYTLPNGHEIVPKKKHQERFYHPGVVWDSVRDPQARKAVNAIIVAFAEYKGVKVPKKFNLEGSVGEIGDPVSGPHSGYYFAALDWLAYPLVREIDSPAFARNLTHMDRVFIAPNFEAMNFKQLVQHYYGACTSKMLEELWKVITVGGDFKRTQFATSEARTAFFEYGNPQNILEDNDEYIIQIGDRRLQTFCFTFGPAIFRTMGFDYFYQAIPFFAIRTTGRMHEGLTQDEPRSKQIEFNLATILKSVSSKKFLNAIFSADHAPDLRSLHDTASMIREYDDHTKIPKSLKMQYPTGLVVDFKFKTLKELHDKISTQYTIIKTEANNREIPVADRYMMLNGITTKSGLRLVVPKRTSTLAVWGKLLNICVASYGDRAARSETLLLGVEKDDAIKYCIEFRSIAVPQPSRPEVLGLFPLDVQPMIEAQMERVAYPRLLAKHAGVMPTDVPDEEGLYHVPAIVQFRGERNCDAVQEDRQEVENLLIDWVRDNFEFLKDLSGIFDSDTYSYNIQWGDANRAVLNQEMIQQAAEGAMNQGMQANQILINPEEYQALNQIVHPHQYQGHNFVVRAEQAINHIPIQINVN